MKERRLLEVHLPISVLEKHGYEVGAVMMQDFTILEARFNVATGAIIYTTWHPAAEVQPTNYTIFSSYWVFTETIESANVVKLTGTLIFGKETITKTITFGRQVAVEGKNSYQQEAFSV